MRTDPLDRRALPHPRPAAAGRRARARRPSTLWEPCEGRVLLTITVSVTPNTSVIRSQTTAETASFTLTLSHADLEYPVTVDYSTADGTATAAANDYVPVTSGSVIFPVDVTTEQISIQIPAKSAPVGSTYFFVNFSATEQPGEPVVVPPGQDQRVVTIVDQPTHDLAIADAPPVPRPDTGSALATFQVTLTPAEVQIPLRVNYVTDDGTAKAANGDYVPQQGTLTFGVGVTTQTINVVVPAKTTHEGNVSFYVDIAAVNPDGPAQVFVSRAVAMATIVDTHPAGTLQFSPATYSVAETAGTVAITVTRTGGDASGVGGTFTTVGGTAQPGVDYQPITGTVNFGFGVTTQTIRIPILVDPYAVANRTFYVVLSDPTGGGTLGTPVVATVTIQEINSLIVTNTNDSGLGSLRQAILTTDSLRSPATISFDIPKADPGYNASNNSWIIAPLTQLPAVTNPTAIDAATQPGYAGRPVIDLVGTNLPTSSYNNGLILQAGASLLRGFAIGLFNNSGLVLTDAGADLIVNTYLGTDPTGTVAQGNAVAGLFLLGSSNNVIGAPGMGDVVSGNGLYGILIANNGVFGSSVSVPSSGNVIQSSEIGTDASGRAAIPNGNFGVSINSTSGNVIGGAGAGNVISGNGFDGVLINGGGKGNLVQGNRIGTDISGTVALPNVFGGVDVADSTGNVIGGTSLGQGNVISGNGSIGVQVIGTDAGGNVLVGNLIGTNALGTAALANGVDGVSIDGAPGNIVGVAGSPNIISGNGSIGVQIIDGGKSNLVQGNRIGTDISGTAALPNVDNGVYLADATGNVIGGTSAGQGNVISGNGSVGVQIVGADGGGNVLLGDLIGTSITGESALGNGDDGVYINGSPGDVIGAAGSPNVISGNGSVGVQINGSSATGNVIQGDRIGTDAAGQIALANGLDGVFLNGAANNLVGGTGSGQGNVISGNGSVGVQIFTAGATGNVIAGNLIGTNAAGTAAVANAKDGVYINNVPNNVVGLAGAGNVISGNGSVGVLISGSLATGNVVQANKIGTDITGMAALANGDDGIYVAAAPANVLGGSGSGQGNLVSGNGTVGIQIQGAVASGTMILGNLVGTNAQGQAVLGNRYGVFLNGFVIDAAASGLTTRNLIAGNKVANVYQQPA